MEASRVASECEAFAPKKGPLGCRNLRPIRLRSPDAVKSRFREGRRALGHHRTNSNEGLRPERCSGVHCSGISTLESASKL
jgi:hypothetical protein